MKEQRIVLINGQVYDCSFGSLPKEYDELVEFDSFEEKEAYIKSKQKYQVIFNKDGSYELKHGCIDTRVDKKTLHLFDTEAERNEFLILPIDKKFNKYGRKVFKSKAMIKFTEGEARKERIAEILEELKQFDDDIIKCAADGLTFAEKYPKQASKRNVLRAERKCLILEA